MPQHRKEDRFDKAFNKKFNIDPLVPDLETDRFEQAFNLRFEQRQEEPQLNEFDTPAVDVPSLNQSAEDFPELPEIPPTPDQEFSEIISPGEPVKKKPSFFSRVKEAFAKSVSAVGQAKTKPRVEAKFAATAIGRVGTLLRKAAQQPVGPGGMTVEEGIGVIATGFGREAAARKVSQSGDIIKKYREGKLQTKDIVGFFRPDKNLKEFWEDLKKINRSGAIFGVTLDDKEVPKELQFRSFVTEFNKLAFEDIDLPQDIEIPLLPNQFNGPTVKLKTLVTMLGFAFDIFDPSIFGISIIGKVGTVGKLAKDIPDIKKALESGTKLTPEQIKVVKELDEISGVAIKEQAEADLIKEIEGFGAEAPSRPLKFEKPGPFERTPETVLETETKVIEEPPKTKEVPSESIPEPKITESIKKPIEKSEEGLLPFKVTSARKADIAKTREQLGLTELNTPERKTWETSLKNAKDKKLDEKALRLSDEVIENPRAFNDEETAGVVIKASDLKNEHLRLSDELSKLTDEADIKITSAEIQRVEEEFDKVSRALKMSGTEKGRALASQKLTIDQDFSLVSVKTRAKAASGKPLTEKQNAKFSELVSNLDKKLTEMAKLEKKVSQLEANKSLSKTPSNKLRKMNNLQKNEALSKLTSRAQKLIDEGCLISV